MQNQQIVLLLLLLTISAAQSISPTQEMNNIIDALIGAGDFTTWVSIITSTNLTILPVSATIFVPRDATVDRPPQDPFILPYHIVPQRLTFSDLLLFPRQARLPTLLTGKYISITDNSTHNFSLDATPLTHPDLFSTPSLSVHGVHNLLDYSLFGEGFLPPPPPFLPIGYSIGDSISPNYWHSGASSYAHLTIHVVFLLLFCFLLYRD